MGKVNTRNDWVNQKYEDFYNKYGYIPKFFQPYNTLELKNVCSTITTNTGTTTGIGTVLVASRKRKRNNE